MTSRCCGSGCRNIAAIPRDDNILCFEHFAFSKPVVEKGLHTEMHITCCSRVEAMQEMRSPFHHMFGVPVPPVSSRTLAGPGKKTRACIDCIFAGKDPDDELIPVAVLPLTEEQSKLSRSCCLCGFDNNGELTFVSPKRACVMVYCRLRADA